MLIMFTMLFSGGLIPTYILITQQLHLSNSFWVTILPMLTSAYNIFIMRNFIIGIPGELEESALIDGAGYFTIFRKIIVPLSKPVLVTEALWIASDTGRHGMIIFFICRIHPNGDFRWYCVNT